MSRRIDIQLTSSRDDGTWTWRAAGAKAPKGVVAASLLPNSVQTGDVFKVEADFDIDGISVLAVVPAKEKSQRLNVLKLIASDKSFTPVTQQLAERGKSDRKSSRRPEGSGPPGNKRTDAGRPDRKRADGKSVDRARPNGARTASTRTATAGTPVERRKPRQEGDAGNTRRVRRSPFTAPPELPKRPAAKRLKPKHTHRLAVLETLPEEQRAVAQRALEGGVKAVRDAIKIQNDLLKREGKPPVPSEGLISMAQELLPKLRVADWLDKAEAAKATVETLDLRDLRSVVVGADDPMVVRDESTRELAIELKSALKDRQEKEQALWREDISAALGVSRVVRALKLSGEPPKAGQPFPADLGSQLAAAATASLTPEGGSDRWIAVLEAVAFSPIRGQVKPLAAPPHPSEALIATVTRLAPLLGQIATLFNITVKPGGHTPRPLRPARPSKLVRAKPKVGEPNPDTTPVEPVPTSVEVP
ncbi:MAG: hypothetical protein ABIQ38_00795 [Ilumatobacteraceae bacterium]